LSLRCGFAYRRTFTAPGARVHKIRSCLVLRAAARYGRPCPTLTSLRPPTRHLAAALAFALRFEGRKRVHNADEIMSEIVAKRLVRHLERAGFVVMQKPPEIGGAAIGRGFEG
jgi:hypothetical protein